jgi:2-hydroxy-3-oxopropionate reductase
MGAPIAANLLRSGRRVHLFSRSGIGEDLLAAGGIACDSPAEVARQSEAIIVMVPDTPDVEAVLFGPNGVSAAELSGKLVIDMSSISPLETRTFAKRIEEAGGKYLDAPVSGGEVGARAATLTIMVGGRLDVFDEARPIFETLGKNISRIGETGAGQVAKIANQIIVALNIEAVAEALLFAAKAGADPEVVRNALLGGFAASRVLEVHGRRMTERTFAPGFRIELHQKDLNLALQSARSLGLALPSTALTQQLLASCVASGDAALDHSAILRSLERLSSFGLRPVDA